MPTYRLTLRRVTREEATVTVKAMSPNHACAKAEDLLLDQDKFRTSGGAGPSWYEQQADLPWEPESEEIFVTADEPEEVKPC